MTVKKTGKFKGVSSSKGEHARRGANPKVADLHRKTSTENQRTGDGKPAK